MARTIKKFPYKIHRNPKGFLRAKRNGARNKAVPPTAWDDLMHDNQCYSPYNVAEHMLQSGLSDCRIVRKLMKKFKLSYYQARKCLWRC